MKSQFYTHLIIADIRILYIKILSQNFNVDRLSNFTQTIYMVVDVEGYYIDVGSYYIDKIQANKFLKFAYYLLFQCL